MKNILEKLDSYQLLTNLLPGAFFGLTLRYLLGFDLPTNSMFEDLIIYYFMGLIINRVGSLIVVPLIKKIRFKKYRFIRNAPYPDYVKAMRKDSKIDTLSEANNCFRSLLTSVLLLPLVQLFIFLHEEWMWFTENWRWISIFLLITIFLFSYRKQTTFIRERVETVISKDSNSDSEIAEKQI